MVFLKEDKGSTCFRHSDEGILTLEKIQLGLAKVLAKTAKQQHTGNGHHSQDRVKKPDLPLSKERNCRLTDLKM